MKPLTEDFEPESAYRKPHVNTQKTYDTYILTVFPSLLTAYEMVDTGDFVNQGQKIYL